MHKFYIIYLGWIQPILNFNGRNVFTETPHELLQNHIRKEILSETRNLPLKANAENNAMKTCKFLFEDQSFEEGHCTR